MIPAEKVCARCQDTKPAGDFYRHKRMASGLHSYCKPCIAQKSREWQLANPERVRERNRREKEKLRRENPRHVRSLQLKSMYGITLEEYEELQEQQRGVCAICETPPAAKRLHIDHDHATGEIRGLLCSRCNTAIGLLDDDVERLQAVIHYLNKRQAVEG